MPYAFIDLLMNRGWYTLRARRSCKKNCLHQNEHNAFLYLLVQCDDIALFGVRSRKAQCQIVCLRSWIDEIADGQIAGHFVNNLFCTVHQFVMQKPIVRWQYGILLVGRFNNFRMAMSHCISIKCCMEINRENTLINHSFLRLLSFNLCRSLICFSFSSE